MLLSQETKHKMERIGLFGGSFDPVHLGHLLVAQAAREELDLSRLFFYPSRPVTLQAGPAANPSQRPIAPAVPGAGG